MWSIEIEGNKGCRMQPYFSLSLFLRNLASSWISSMVLAPCSVFVTDHFLEVSYRLSDGHS